MLTKTNVRLAVAVGFLATVGIGVLIVSADDTKVSIDQVPDAARQALQKLAGGAPFTEVESETEHGVTVYEAEWTVNGVEHEASVTADGTLLETEETVPAAKVPPAVRAAIAKHFGPTADVKIEKKMIVIYEAEAQIDGREKEILIFPTGRVHEDEHDDDNDDDDNDDDDD